MANILKLGVRLELLKSGYVFGDIESNDYKYQSTILDVDDYQKNIVISIPVQKAKMIPMHKNEKYNVFFYVGNKIYSSKATVIKNITEGKVRSVLIHLDTDLNKIERRQFFRLDVVMDVRYLLLSADNTEAFKMAVKTNSLLTMEGFKDGTTCDLSGGGLKFTARDEFPIGSLLIIHFKSDIGGKVKNYVFIGKVLDYSKHDTVRGLFVYRVQFVDLKQDAREELVQYIFQKEREKLKNGR